MAIFQLAMVFAIAVFTWLVWDVTAALSAAYGVAVTLIMTLLMLARERESEAHPEWTAQRQLGQFFRLEAERFLVAGALLALGFLSGRAAPLALIAGFVLGQLGWLAAMKGSRAKTGAF